MEPFMSKRTKRAPAGPRPIPETISHEDNLGLTPAQWRRRNGMSRSEWHRRRKRIANGEDPGLLPERVRVSAQREIITLKAEAAWRAANVITAEVA